MQAIDLVASIALKSNEQGLLEYAAQFRQVPQFYSPEHLLRYTERLSEKSQYVFDAVGCWGVAEAAALAAAESLGGTAELVIKKHKNARATFALARTYLEDMVWKNNSLSLVSDPVATTY